MVSKCDLSRRLKDIATPDFSTLGSGVKMSFNHKYWFALNFFFFHSFRYCFKWFDRKVFCISNFTSSGTRGQNWPCPPSGERCPRDSNPVICLGHVNAGPVQYLPPFVLNHVHICHFWHVFFHECQAHRGPWQCVQFWNFWQIYDPLIPNVNQRGLGWCSQCNYQRGWLPGRQFGDG